MVSLTKGQVKDIIENKKKLKLTEKQYRILSNYYDHKLQLSETLQQEASGSIKLNSEHSCDVDYTTDFHSSLEWKSAQAAKIILDNCEIIEPVYDGKINIGTEFMITITSNSGKVESKRLTMSEIAMFFNDGTQCISCECPLGQLLLSKTVGDTFCYSHPDIYCAEEQYTVQINEIVASKTLTR